MPLYIGTSGWQYDDWRGVFYPERLAKREWLRHFAEQFQAVEVNNTFYRLPERRTFESWHEETPDDFIVAAKMSRFLTYVRRLQEPKEPIERFFDRAAPLGRKLGPVLLQLPPNMPADIERLDGVLAALPLDARVAVEFRHESWYTNDMRDVLARHNATLCLADRDSRPVTPLWRTADWGYVRMHIGRARPYPCYGRDALDSWARRVSELWGPQADVFVFFNNDTHGCAVRDARLMARAARRHGLTPSRVPGVPAEVAA